MTFPGTRSRRRWSASWAAAASAALLLAASLACSSNQTASTPTPSPSPTVQPGESPSPTPSGDETPVAPQVLPPATDLPIGQLCSAPVTTTSDGNVVPLLCRDGAVNVLAWAYYSTISQSILGLGLNPNEGQPQSAMCDDVAHNGATLAKEASAYRLAAAYYGWSFAFDPTKVTCQ